nr:regucalcin-like isoform X1 [Procambarus clarkii]
MSEDYKVEPVTGTIGFGEGPHWSVEDQALYFVDFFEQLVRRYHPETDTHTKLHIEGGPVTMVVPHKTGPAHTFVVSVGLSLVAVTWPDPTQDLSVTADDLRLLATVEQDLPDNRFNDGKCDTLGRLFAGTMSTAEDPDHMGNLYRLDTDRTITKVVEKQVTLSNGLAWTEDNSTMYYNDTLEYKVNAFDFDLSTGALSGRRVVFDFQEAGLSPAQPDGMTIDTDGNIWVPGYGVGTVFNIDPSNGDILRVVNIPSLDTTSVSWGGPDLDQLFVTCGNAPVYRVTGLGVKGFPANACTVDLPTGPRKKQ